MATFTVTNLNDSGAGSLRQAVTDANTAVGADTIQFQAGLTGTIRLTSGQLVLSDGVTINGDTNGDRIADITISGDANNNSVADTGDSRIFDLASTNISLTGLTLTNGFSTLSGGGGAVRVKHGAALVLSDSTITNSVATEHSLGGGIINYGTMTVLRSTIAGNYAYSGGGIANVGTATIVATTLMDNSATYGGGFYNRQNAGPTISSATLVDTTLSGNTASQYGGGIGAGHNGGTLSLLNSTVTNNSAGNSGGGVDLYGGLSLAVVNSVIAGNGAGGDLNLNSGSITARNSFFGTMVTLTTDLGGNINNGGSPGLAPLAFNGGPVQTHAILPDSPLIGKGDATALPQDTADLDRDTITSETLPLDASGNARVVAGTLDIGATEFQLVVTTLDDVVANDGKLSLREALTLANTAADSDVITFAPGLSGTIRLTSGLTISNDVKINGGSAITISGDANDSGANDSGDVRIFNIINSNTEVELRGLTLTGGRAENANGGAILAASGTTLTLVNSTVTKSSATGTGGAGIGGGIGSAGTLNVASSTIHGNEAANFGGGVYVAGGTGTFVNATIANNMARDGAGIDTGSGSHLYIQHSTISSNTATRKGGGIDLFSNFTSNKTTAVIYNSIVSGNTATAYAGTNDVSRLGVTGATLLIGGFSVLGTGVVVDGGAANSITSTDNPQLGLLQNNGGPVLTLRPGDGSPANGRGDDSHVPLDTYDVDGDGNRSEKLPTDARGNPRSVGFPDAGAYERSNQAPVAVDDNNAGDAVKEDVDNSAIGNVLTNDTDFNIGDTKAVTAILSIGLATNFVTVSASPVSISGLYGNLTINPNGSYTYLLDNSRAATNVLAAGATVHDIFSYLVADTLGLTSFAQLDITVTGTNDAPVIENYASAPNVYLAYTEGTSVPFAITASDAENATLTYAIVGGADAARFSINTATGVFSFITSPDFEVPTDANGDNVYQVTIRATDGTLFDDQTYNLTITNVTGYSVTGSVDGDIIGGPSAQLPATEEEDFLDGGAGNDTIFALGGNDTVRGGLGKDIMDGGAGRDTVDYADKTKPVTLTLNGATPTIVKVGAAEDTLSNFESVIGGSAGDKLTGDGFDNLLSGLGKNDVLKGGGGNDTLIGGLGADSLTGDAGTDFFLFNVAATTANADKITDFTPNVDFILLDDAFFGAIGIKLDPNEFVSGPRVTKALDADDRILYDTKTGSLYYDPDGNGAAKAVKFATLTNKPLLLDHEDFLIV